MEEIINPHRKIITWIQVLSIIGALITWLIASPIWVYANYKTENDHISMVYGQSIAEKVDQWSRELSGEIYKKATSRLTRKKSSYWAASRGKVARWLLAFYIQRSANMLMMAVLLLPFAAAAFIDGWAYWRISRDEKREINLTRHTLGFYFVNVSMALPLALLLLPIALHPLMFSVYWLILAFGLRTIMRHMQYKI